MAQQYDFISSDTHLEVLPERWTGRVPARYRDQMPRTVTHPDGGDAIQIEGAPLFQAAYLDLRAGRDRLPGRAVRPQSVWHRHRQDASQYAASGRGTWPAPDQSSALEALPGACHSR